MSGRKTITVDSARFTQLQQEANSLQNLQSDYRQLESEYARSQQEFQDRYGQILNRQTIFENNLANLGQEFRQYQQATNQRIQQMDADLRLEITNTAYNLRNEFNQKLDEQNLRLTNMVNQERAERQRQFDGLQQQINTLVVDKERKAEIAKSWLKETQNYFVMVDQNYKHQFFVPGRMAKIRLELDQATQNQQQGFSDAALVTAQEKFFELSELRIELEAKEREWETWRFKALEEARRVLTFAQANRKVKAFDLDENELDIEIEADFWTKGKLSALKKRINDQLDELEKDVDKFNTEQLKEIAEKICPDMHYAVMEVIKDARLEVIGSQMRLSIADTVMQVLSGQGFTLQDHTFLGEDLREEFYEKAGMIDGSEVVVKIQPDPVEPGKNILEIHQFCEGQTSESDFIERANSIYHHCNEQGLKVASPQQIGQNGDELLRNFKEIRKVKIQLTEEQRKITQS